MKEHRFIFRHKHDQPRHNDKPDKAHRLNERICPYCNGSGYNSNFRLNTMSSVPARCSICGGSGRIPI